MSVWLTAEDAIALMGIKRRWFYEMVAKDKLTTRAGAKAANGRHQKEIALESLPPEIQARYFKSFDSAQDRSQISNEAAAVAAAEGGLATPATIGEFTAGESVKAVHLPANAEPEPPSRAEAALSPNQPEAASQVRAVREPPLLLQKTDSANAGVPRAIHESPLHGMSEEKLDALIDYAEKLKTADGKPRQQRRWIARHAKVSLSTLDRDIAAFRDRGLAALVRQPRADHGGSRVADNKVVARIAAEYLKPHRPSVKIMHKILARDFTLSGLLPPSYSFVRRAVKRIAPDLVARFRIGEREFDNKFAYYSERERPLRPGMWIQGDHHEFDYRVVFPDGKMGRPWLTSMIDTCTGIITGMNIPRDKKVGDGRSPGSASIALALRHALLKKKDPAWPSCGLFEHLYVDLGKDYRSAHVRAICADLGIKIVHTRGYHGKSKAHKERWFGVLEAGLKLKNLPGYCGNKPETNPERQNLKPAPLDPKKLLSLDEFEAEVRRWVVEEYHHAESRSLGGISPMEALAAHVKNGFAAREVRDERVLDLLLMRREIRKNKKGEQGIKVHRRGILLFNRFFLADELLPLIGQYVDSVGYDPADLGEVLVYKDERLICTARNAELSRFGASAATLKREREIKQKQKNSLRERYEEILKSAQYGGDPLAQAAAEEIYQKLEGEERQKLAVNASADSVPVLLPKFARAVKVMSEKALHAKSTSVLSEVKKKSQVRAVREPPLLLSQEAPKKEPWEEEEPLPTGAEIFRREEKADWEKALDAEEEEL